MLRRVANDHLLTPALWSSASRFGHAASLPGGCRRVSGDVAPPKGDRDRALRRQAIELIGALNEMESTPVPLLKGGLTLFDGPCHPRRA